MSVPESWAAPVATEPETPSPEAASIVETLLLAPPGPSEPPPPPSPAGYSSAPLPADSPPLARLLVDAGRVSQPAMTTALEQSAESGESLARYLFSRRIATEDDLVWAMAQEVGLEFVDLNQINIDRAAVALIPQSTAEHHMVLPIAFENGVPVVAMANPTDVFAMDDLRTIMGSNFKPVVATRSQLVTFNRLSRDSTCLLYTSRCV